MSPPRPTVPRLVLVALVSGLLAMHVWLALSATIQLGVTADETAHLTAGYSYWKFNDYRLQPENGNLPQRWAALPLLAQPPHLDPTEQPDAWGRSHVWLISQRFFFESGNSTEFLLLCARTTTLLWSVATGLLVFGWSRRLWGDGGALLSLALFAFSPTVLAHGPLVTSDMCAAFWLLACAGAWWRVTERLEPRWLLLSLLAAGGAAVAKFSAVLLLPVAALLALWRLAQRQPLPISLGRGRGTREAVTRWQKLLVLAALGALHLGGAALVIWACFGFRYSALGPEVVPAWKFFAAWDKIVPDQGLLRWFFAFGREHHLLPEAYLQGFAFVVWAAKERGAFLLGEFSINGWWWFFPYAFFAKSSLAELAAAAGVAGVAGWRAVGLRGPQIGRQLARFAPLLILGVVYGGFSIASTLNIGHRHILPLYPILFIVAGRLACTASWRRGVVTGLALIGLAAVETLAVRPDFLAFFNRAAGGPEAGWRQLADSSLDWGQNLPRLAEWLQNHRQPGEPVYVSTFGSDDPFYHGIAGQELAPYYSFGRQRRWIELQPGLYCLGATMLQDVYSPYAGAWTLRREVDYQKLLRLMRAELAAGTRSPDLGEHGEGPERLMWNLDRARFARLCLYLRERKPDAVIGHSLFVFRLQADEVRVAVDGTMSELATAMSAAAARRTQGN